MAGDDDNISTGSSGNDVMELEAMRKEDSSWHPCQVSMCPTRVGLIVYFVEDGFEDIILNKKEAVARIRIRSVPLQGDDCFDIQQGHHILATQQSANKSLYFNAKVETVLRVRHSKRMPCRCTFTVKWLHQELKETIAVSSSLIMKLATGNINSHPTISKFMNTVQPLVHSSTSALSAIANDTEDEMDLNDLLDKQIEVISSSAVIPKKTIAKDILFGVEVDRRQLQQKAKATSKESNIRLPSVLNQMRRSTRSCSKLLTEVDVKVSPQTAKSIEEKLIESRPHLNPLAARAALASLMFKKPLKPEFSVYHDEEKSISNYTDIITYKEVTVDASNGTKPCFSSVANHTTRSRKHTFSNGNSSVLFISETDCIVRSLFSSADELRKPQLVDAYSEVMEKESKDKYSQEVFDNCSDLKCSVKEQIIRQTTRRVTRSTARAQQCMGISGDVVDKKVGAGETKSSLRANGGRLAHSKVHLEEKFQNNETQNVMEENTQVNYAESNPFEKIVKTQECNALRDQSMFPSQSTFRSDLLSDEEVEMKMRKETSKVKYDTQRGTRDSKASNSNNTKRFTRSMLRSRTTEVTPVLEDNELYAHKPKVLPSGNATALVSNVFETKESTSSPLHADLTLHFAEVTHGKNKRRMSGEYNFPENDEENVTGNGGSGQGKKKSKSLSKLELRCSPRLRLRTLCH